MELKDIEQELTEIELEKVRQFNQDEVLVEAVRKIMLASLYTNGRVRKGKKSNPLQNAAFYMIGTTRATNEQIGEDLRAVYQGVQALETGFLNLSKIKQKVEETNPTNEAI